MVKVTFRPWKEIVVHETVKYDSLEKFIELKTTGLPKGIPIEPLLWADGVLFTRVLMGSTADVVKDMLQGTLHFLSVEYVPMQKYQKSITHGETTLNIIDVTKTEPFRDMVKALKKGKAIRRRKTSA